jgi:hypothetical protein
VFHCTPDVPARFSEPTLSAVFVNALPEVLLPMSWNSQAWLEVSRVVLAVLAGWPPSDEGR